MKYGYEIGLSTISPKNKQGDGNIKTILYGINQVLYDYNKRYITPLIASSILQRLKDFGVKLKELDVKIASEKKKEEILTELRKRCKSIVQYEKEFKWDSDSAQCITITMKYQLSMYIKEKDTDSLDLISFLKRNREIWECMYLPCPNRDSINTTKFEAMQRELLSILNEPYQLVS